MVSFFNDAIGDLAGIAAEALTNAVDAIPEPVSTDFLSLIDYITCPLTPLALGLGGISDLTNGDLNTQLKRLQGLQKGTIDKARREFEQTLANTPEAKMIQQGRKLDRQIRQLNFDAESFAEAVLITAVVQSVCDQQEFDEIFGDFAILSADFASKGGLLGVLNTNLAAMQQQLIRAETKFSALRVSLYNLG